MKYINVIHGIKIVTAICLICMTLAFGIDNTVDCSKIVAPECEGLGNGYITGMVMNGTTIITRISNDSVSLLRSICEIAKTPDVYIISEHMQVHPILPTEQIVAKISYNYALFVVICCAESLLLLIFILEAFNVFDNNGRQSYDML